MHFSELSIVQRNHHEKENMKTETFFFVTGKRPNIAGLESVFQHLYGQFSRS